MRNHRARFLSMLLVAAFTTGAVHTDPLSPPTVGLEEYLEADDWFQAGITLNGEGRYGEAAEAFAKGLSIEPGNPLSWLNYGTALALVGDYPHAIDALQKSVSIDPTLALGFANLAEVCFRSARFQEAIDAYTSLLALWPQNPNALYKRGLAYLSLHEAGKAQAEYLALKMVDPDLAEKLLQSILSAARH